MAALSKTPTGNYKGVYTSQPVDTLVDFYNAATGNGGTAVALTAASLMMPVNLVAATGSVLATAAQLSYGVTLVSASDATKCVKLPAAPATQGFVILFNSVANQPLIIFPDAAATINGIASHGALTCANGVPVILYNTSATQWYTLPLLPS